MVEDFFAEDKASIIKFCTVFHRHPGQAVLHFRELCSIKSPKSDTSGMVHVLADLSSTLATHRISLCGYTSVSEDGLNGVDIFCFVVYCMEYCVMTDS